MKIYIDHQDYLKHFLLSTQDGQKILSDAKNNGIRAYCGCLSGMGPAMYVSQRGKQLFLARMPGTAKLHHHSCRSHIVEINKPTDNILTTMEISQSISNYFLSNNISKFSILKWPAIRGILLDSIRSNGRLKFISDMVFIPKSFRSSEFDQHKKCFDDFLTLHAKNGNFWVIAPFKSIIERKYNYQLKILHLPFLSFWVKKELQLMFSAIQNENQLNLLVMSCCVVPSGLDVCDISFIDIQICSSDLKSVAQGIGLPSDLSDEEIKAAILSNFVTSFMSGQKNHFVN